MGHADTLLAMGGAFLAAAFFARLGGRIGLPTIPLFMLAGVLLGLHTPGVVLVEDARDFEMLSALGLVLLLFYLGLEFHLDDLRSGGRRLPTAGGIYLLLNVGAGLGFGFALGWGLREALVLAGVLPRARSPRDGVPGAADRSWSWPGSDVVAEPGPGGAGARWRRAWPPGRR